MDKCMRIELNKDDESTLKRIIRQYKQDHRTIEINDFGSGSKIMGNKRKISSILKNSSSKGKYARLFYQMSAYYKPGRILEFGTSLGIGTVHFALGFKAAKITTVEACKHTHDVAKSTFSNSKIENILSVNATFQEFIDSNASDNQYDVIFIDGHHDGTALESYLHQLDNLIGDETIVILDDIRWSDSMLNSWINIQNQEKYHVSIDLFRMGILVKRNHQEKEHFVIRF